MARTFNRNPLQIPAPSSGDVKNYFFNHFNWKGVDRNKNFLAVDQETFADAKNVCVDNEGILRSRPAIKSAKNSFNDILNFWKFDDVEVYLRKDGDILRLQFFKEGTQAEDRPMHEDVQLAYVDRKIFVFGGSQSFSYYDVDDLEVKYDFRIYEPNTTFDAAGVETDIEDKNVLTDSQRYTYFYSTELGISSDAYGKDVYTIIDGKRYDFTFTDRTMQVLSSKKFTLNSEHFRDGVLQLAVSCNDSYALYSTNSRTLAYSVDGRIFDKLLNFDSSFGDVIGKPKFSHDGNYIVMATNKGLYIVSIIADTSDGTLRYSNFTEIVTFDTPSNAEFENVEFDFDTYDSYAYAVTKSIPHVGSSTYTQLYCYKDETLSAKEVDGLCVNLSYSSSFIGILEDGAFNGAVFTGLVDIGLDDIERIYWTVSSTDFNKHVAHEEVNVGWIYDSVVTANGIALVVGANNQYRYFKIKSDLTYSDGHTLMYNKQQWIEDIGNGVYLSPDGLKILLDVGVYYTTDKTLTPIIVKESDRIYPQAFSNHVYYTMKPAGLDLYSSIFNEPINLYRRKGGEINIFWPTHIATLNEQFIAVDNILYITESRDDEDGYLWYIPERNKHVFKSNIHKLCPISTTEMGVFLDDEIWIVTNTELGYQVIKSKLSMGLKDGSDVITSYDGSKTIFCSERGLVALSYQDFVASSEQVLTILSDPIHDEIVDFAKVPVKLFMSDFWLIIYNGTNKFYIFDLRNNSWWPCEYDKPISKIVKLNEINLLCNRKFYCFDNNHAIYSDDGKIIDWYITSQKLHLNATNYYKHIVNLTLSSIIEVNSDEPLTYDMDIINYRDGRDVGKSQTLEYKVQSIRTFVQRLNHFKVNEFQYTLRTDHDNKIQLPLSISDITVKYKIQGQVR